MNKLIALLAFIFLTTFAHAEPAGPYNWSNAYMRQAPSKIGAAYVHLKNPTQSDDVLIGATASWAERIELHEIKTGPNSVMQMQKIEKMDLPKNSVLILEQGSYHLMVFGIKENLKVDERKNITLKFQKAGSVVIPFTIQPIGMNQESFKKNLIMDHSHHHGM